MTLAEQIILFRHYSRTDYGLFHGIMGDMDEKEPVPLSGRRVEAARNDQRILDAAREVFIADPGAPVSAVAKRAGVGISALYRRYASKEDLLRRLCAEGLQQYIAAAEDALADEGDPWNAFTDFMRRVVDADTHSLTLRLAGTFTPTEELNREAAKAQELNVRLFDRTKAAGAIGPASRWVDIAMLFEQLAAIRVADEERTRQLRHRYLALILEALHAPRGPSCSALHLAGRRSLSAGRPDFSPLTRRLHDPHAERRITLQTPNSWGRVAMARPVRIILVYADTNRTGRLRMVVEIIGRLPKLTESQLGRLEDEIRRERQRRASSPTGGEQDVPGIAEGAAPPVTEVLEYRSHEDGYLQLELRRYIRRDGSARERGPYWYFQFHEDGKRKKLYLGKTNDPERTLAAKRAVL